MLFLISLIKFSYEGEHEEKGIFCLLQLYLNAYNLALSIFMLLSLSALLMKVIR